VGRSRKPQGVGGLRDIVPCPPALLRTIEGGIGAAQQFFGRMASGTPDGDADTRGDLDLVFAELVWLL